MKRLFFLFSIFTACGLFAGDPFSDEETMLLPDHGGGEFSFHVHKRCYSFSTEFDLETEGIPFAQGVKSLFHFRTQYDLYNQNGSFAAQGIHSLVPSLGLGWFYSWAADIYVYDSQGRYLGMIDGTLYTKAPAKYIFYNSEGKRIANAYMACDRCRFVIQSSQDKNHIIADMQRHLVRFEEDQWTVRIFDENAIPHEMIQLFAIFACDRQKKDE